MPISRIPGVGLETTGTGSVNTFLRGDNAWAGTITSGTAVASTSGTSIDFTGIPSTAKRVTVMFDQVSLNGASEIMIQLGTSGGIQNTSYFGTCGFSGASNGSFAFSTGFVTFVDLAAAQALSGLANICLLSIATTGTWTYSGNFAQAASYTTNGAGSKTLSGTLDRVRITTVNGTDTFDAGTINIMWES